MENNHTHPAPEQNDTSTRDHGVSFPSNGDTQLRDISTLLQGAPVISQDAAGLTQPGSEIATAEDFSQVEESRPFARKVGPKALFGAGLALLIVVPLAAAFMGGGDSSNNRQQTAEVGEASREAGSGVYLSPEDYAAQQAEIEQLRSQRAFIDQQVDAEAIDAAGRQRQQQHRASEPSSTQTASTSTASRSAPTTAQPTAITVRPAPAPTSATASPARPAPVTLASRLPAPATSWPSAQPSARQPEPVDPFERRAQLQALGSYGAPPPMAKANQPVSYAQASNPFETEYIQAISLTSQPAISTSSKEIALVERPLTAAELQYEQDAAAVLSTEPFREENTVAAVEDEQIAEANNEQPEAAAPMAILPGTSTAAELPYGFSWQEGAPLPEVVLSTSEDIMAGGQVAIPAGTQFLGQAQIDSRSGAVTIQIVGMFGEAQISIPRASVVVQAEDGSVLTASASSGASRSSGPNMGGFFMESIRNGLGNVINGDNNLAIDIAGGMAETIIDNQLKRSEAIAAARNSRTSSAPTLWTLNARPVRLTFNNYTPVSNAPR